MLRKGHHGVRLDAEAWDRLVTWIDLNAPCHGTWGEVYPIPDGAHARRMELRKAYGGPADDPEAIPDCPRYDETPVEPAPLPECPSRRADAGADVARPITSEMREKTVELADGVVMKLVRIPAGRVRHGRCRGRAGRTPADAGRDRQAFLDGRVRGHERAVPGFRSVARLPVLPETPRPARRSGPLAERARPAGRPRLLEAGDGVLPLALREDGHAIHAADGGPVGIRLPGGDRDAAALWRPRCRLLRLGQSGGFVLRRSECGQVRRDHGRARASGPGRRGAQRAALQRRIRRDGSGGAVPAERLGALRHARQRRGVDCIDL